MKKRGCRAECCHTKHHTEGGKGRQKHAARGRGEDQRKESLKMKKWGGREGRSPEKEKAKKIIPKRHKACRQGHKIKKRCEVG